nr:MAG TPA_asm: actin-like protein [Bacteriophage sp.]
MRYCKGRLKIRLSNAPRKNDFRNKDIFLENR